MAFFPYSYFMLWTIDSTKAIIQWDCPEVKSLASNTFQIF
jgi:hypothetical protein